MNVWDKLEEFVKKEHAMSNDDQIKNSTLTITLEEAKKILDDYDVLIEK